MTPQRLKNKELVPPDGFRFTVAETGYTVQARDYQSWVEKTKTHYRSNGLNVPPDLEDQMTSQLCMIIPPGWCERPGTTINTRMRWSDVVDGMKAFATLMISGSFVSKEEADRRAYICAGCPLNVNLEGCGTCRKVATLVTGGVAKRTTNYDHNLRTCAICHCVLKAKVHFDLDSIESTSAVSRQASWPEWCWLRRDGMNYRGVAKSGQGTGLINQDSQVQILPPQ